MKDVGYTDNGSVLIELSREEYDEFARLCLAVEGRTYTALDYRERRFQSGFDFSKVFEVIRAFYENAFYINQFEKLLEDMENSIHKKG